MKPHGVFGALKATPRLRLAVIATLPFVLFTTPAHALGLGPVQSRSSLGEPLHVQIPVNATSADDVGCIQVSNSADLPGPGRPHAQVVTLPGGAIVIDITTPLPTNDPAIGFNVSAGCTAAISRSYTVFLDPPLPGFEAPSVPSTASTASAIRVAPRRRRDATSNTGRASGSSSAVTQSSRPAAALAPQKPAAERPNRRAPPKPVVAPVTPIAAVPDSGAGDRFHLSSDIGTDLRLADTLGTPDAQPIDAIQLQALKDERARLAAILAGQNPADVPSARETDLQNRVNTMAGQLNQLRQQVAQQDAHAKELEQTRSPGFVTWIFALIAFLALMVAGWVGWRYRRAQSDSSDQPWWEQSQLANVTERVPVAGVTPFGAVREDAVDVRRGEIVEPEVLDHDTFIQTARKAAAPVPLAATRMPLTEREVSPAARGPETMPLVNPPGAGTPALAAVGNAPAANAPPPAASLFAPVGPAAASQYGDAKSALGSLDERIDSSSVKPLDFNLDLPAVTGNLGRDEKGVAATGSLRSEAVERPTEMAPLDFELPKTSASPNEAASLGPDTILRLDAQHDVAEGAAQVASADGQAEQASVQFRLIQFASVVEQAEELGRSQEPTRAIATLRQYVLRDETIPTLMWLMLFGLYKQVNKRPVYDALGEHFSRRYKRPMARWDESLQSIAPQVALASLPELDAEIRAKWGTQAGIELLRALTCGRDQPNDILFNAALQRELLQMAKIFPLNDTQ